MWAILSQRGRARMKRNMSTKQSKKEACGERLRQAHLIFLAAAAHSPTRSWGPATSAVPAYTVPHCKEEEEGKKTSTLLTNSLITIHAQTIRGPLGPVRLLEPWVFIWPSLSLAHLSKRAYQLLVSTISCILQFDILNCRKNFVFPSIK